MRAMIPIDELSTIFADVTPLPQDDGPEPVCVIEYPTAFAIAYDYMRAIWKTKEFSGTYRDIVEYWCTILTSTRIVL
jgi:protein farnesyltransferase/geranylgeranyltransferase type-1 subunit alpha